MIGYSSKKRDDRVGYSRVECTSHDLIYYINVMKLKGMRDELQWWVFIINMYDSAPKTWYYTNTFFTWRCNWGHTTGHKAMMQIQNWAKMQQNFPSISFCSLHFRTCRACPRDGDMSRTFSTKLAWFNLDFDGALLIQQTCSIFSYNLPDVILTTDIILQAINIYSLEING